jgi:hypothetical protein
MPLTPSAIPTVAAAAVIEVLEAYNDGVQIVSITVTPVGDVVEVTVLPDPDATPRVDRFELNRIPGFVPVWRSA